MPDVRAPIVGVTGHRPAGLRRADLPLLRTNIRQALDGIAAATGASPIVVSPLAEGADRLIAHAALDAGLALRCVLPFPREVYARDFATAASRADYVALLARAAEVVELRGSVATQVDRDAGYVAAGEYTVAESDMLMAVWDGEAPRGRGGAGEVVTRALAHGTPVMWIAAAAPHDIIVLVAAADGAERRALADLPTVLPAERRGDVPLAGTRPLDGI